MLRLAAITLSGLRTAWLLYWLPRSEWKYRPRSGFRIIRAFLSAVTTNSASKVSQELPSYHFSAEEIQDHSQVQPSFHRRNISNIADPDLVDSTGLQILYQIGYSAISRHCRAPVGRTACDAPPVHFHASAALLDSLRTRSHPGEALGSPGDCRNAPYSLQSLTLSASPDPK